MLNVQTATDYLHITEVATGGLATRANVDSKDMSAIVTASGTRISNAKENVLRFSLTYQKSLEVCCHNVQTREPEIVA